MYKVYLYTNKINGKKYCGITKQTIEERRRGGYYRVFANALEKYGLENFDVKILHEVETLEEASYLEKKIISELNLKDRRFGYNIAEGGFGGYSCSGYTEEEYNEYRKKLSEAQHERYKDIDERYKCANYGIKNGNYGKGLKGSKNGNSDAVCLQTVDGKILQFETQRECREYLGIGRDMFRSMLSKNKPYEFPKSINKAYKEKYKHLEGIYIYKKQNENI